MLECMRVGQVRAHQAALQEIADDNGGNRFAGLAGHNASVDYVVDTLEAAGWDVSLQEFDYTAFRVLGPSALQQTAPGTVTYVEDVDFGVIDQSDPGTSPPRSRPSTSSSGSETPRRAAVRLRTSRASPRGTSRCSSAVSARSS